jgi:hypothetical protein
LGKIEATKISDNDEDPRCCKNKIIFKDNLKAKKKPRRPRKSPRPKHQ